ncbi:NTP transferase domain-containing protein [Nakamurella endophytica]|uniref:NTP transferase domain-containing protein n=1 Tax=Nakamurella endophytica TaxID=1748367 RepID=UPI001E623011|nr:NTP transferase domain-containing protein [Nakamurella endophytica]
MVLAGGAGRRLGGVDKPALRHADRSLLDVALAAVAGARVVVVGPERAGLAPGVRSVREQPPGGGPAAGIAAGVRALAPGPEAVVAVLAADQPGVSAGVVAALVAALRSAAPAAAGARAAGPDGRGQQLLSVWRAGDLAAAVGRRVDWTGRSVRELLAGLPAVDVPVPAGAVADIDTPDDLERWRRPAADSTPGAAGAGTADRSGTDAAGDGAGPGPLGAGP